MLHHGHLATLSEAVKSVKCIYWNNGDHRGSLAWNCVTTSLMHTRTLSICICTGSDSYLPVVPQHHTALPRVPRRTQPWQNRGTPRRLPVCWRSRGVSSNCGRHRSHHRQLLPAVKRLIPHCISDVAWVRLVRLRCRPPRLSSTAVAVSTRRLGTSCRPKERQRVP